jgi:2-polyprenyl-3-methyl-5-hydroxy-6-metoxy-1,4-benzoquinol methylase
MKTREHYSCCPLCNSKNFKFLLHVDCSTHPIVKQHTQLNNLVDWNKCDDCHHIFTSDFFTADAFDTILKSVHKDQMTGSRAEIMRIEFGEVVEKIARHKQSGDWLDIGCGSANLLFVVKEFGFNASGIDLRNENVVGAQHYGLDVSCTDIINFHPNKKFDVISLTDVIEHIPYPVPSLEKIYNLLNNNGLLLISTPNYETGAWVKSLEDNTNPYLYEVEHCHTFSRSRLYKLLNDIGFDVVEYGISKRFRLCMDVIAVKTSKNKFART